MHSIPSKYSSDIFLKVSVKKFHNSEGLEDFDAGHHDAPINLSSKIGEYMVRIGDSNDFCFNIIVQLLTEGKVRVDFRDSTERLQLVNKQDSVSRVEAVKVFDHWVQENRGKPELLESTRKVVLEPPRAKAPATGLQP
jgi:hypothetical protein